MDFSKLVYAYAISGGIGSGKSVACEILHSLGYAVIDCDKLAHQVLKEKSQEIIQKFGTEIVENKEINRLKLGEIVFDSDTKRDELERIVYPLVKQKLWEECKRLEEQKKIYFVEIPLLFEKLQQFNFSHKILIYAPKALQIERVKKRNKMSEEAVKSRLQAQMDIEEKRKLANWIIKNTSTQEDLKANILKWIEQKYT